MIADIPGLYFLFFIPYLPRFRYLLIEYFNQNIEMDAMHILV